MVAAGADLTADDMELSQVAKTIDGSGYAYVQLDCVGKGVASLALLSEFPHLREINLAKNRVQDVAPVGRLAHVLRLSLAENRIDSIACWGPSDLCHLMFLDLSGNQLKALPKLHMPALKEASFARNNIVSCEDFQGHASLKVLDLSGNRLLESLEGLCSMPLLERLNVAENSLASLKGVKEVPGLTKLSIAKNGFEALSGPLEELASITSLDASGNKLSEAKELEQLSRLPKLKRLDVAANPLEEVEGINVRLEVVICHRQIEVVDGENVTEEEREEAKALYEQRIEEERERQRLEEEAKKEAEEEARREAEEAAAAAAAEAEAAGEEEQ